MVKRKRVTAVILAAGSGSRMQIEENKVYLPLGGRPVVAHSIATFDAHPYIDELVLVTREEEQAYLSELAAGLGLTKPWRTVLGGATRQASVHAAIRDLDSHIVLVHDGARPFMQPRHITECVDALNQYDGAIVAYPVTERIVERPKRNGRAKALCATQYAAQTPQCFPTKLLQKCHQRHQNNPAITDDSSLLELEGYRVGIVSGDIGNLKVTTPLDLPLAEGYLPD
ncbi:MAG: 2-C-methyl-D-erythritol 4-phosphate cytidylyltransferase [Oscillospiraceae bacterium]|nr:2-C-methyl-D-erythritol 4-phosphate cytidylyltransferase [Oscillospiraceae bacterium]